MTDELVDPRHSAAFQRGYTGASSSIDQASSSRAGAPASPAPAGEAPVAPPARGRRRGEPSVAGAAADPFAAVTDIDDLANATSADPMVDDPAGPDDRARRSFLVWTVALFVIGAVLCLASFSIFFEFNYTRWGAIDSSGSGEWIVRASDGSETRTIGEFEYMMTMFLMENASWLGIIGLATIIGNLFRIAPRRPRS